MPNPSELARQEHDRATPSAEGEIGERINVNYLHSISRSDLDEALSALYGAREVLGDIANLSHAIGKLEAVKNNG